MVGIAGGALFAQPNTGAGIAWGALSPSEPLVLTERFQAFPGFHTDNNPNEGNSDNKFGSQEEVILGFRDDTAAVDIAAGNGSKIRYYFSQCAFAPHWLTAYAYRDSLASGSGANSDNVSRGFVEISRNYGASGGNAPTVRGYFTVDLRELEFVEVIQWSHSSTGGNKRGAACEISLDNGVIWDTLRYQPGTNYTASFTKDITSGVKTSNLFRCDPSAYGMTWEDGIYAGNVMLRFLEAGGQTARIHDLRVYGTPGSGSGLSSFPRQGLRIYVAGGAIRISESARIAVYDLTGQLVRQASCADRISTAGLRSGIYLVKAHAGRLTGMEKIFVK